MERHLAYIGKPNTMQEDRILILMSRKLSGEATVAELEELLEMLERDPGIYYVIKMLTDFWKTNRGADRLELEKAYQRHLKRAGGEIFSSGR